MRIDAHQHFWRYDPVEYAWIDATMIPLRRDFLPQHLGPQLQAAGFEGCIAVQARQSLEETRWLSSLAEEHPFIAGVVGWVDLQSPEVDEQLDRARHPKLVGIRHIVQSEPDDFLRRPEFQRGIAALERFDLAYDLLVYPHHLPMAAALVERFECQRFVLDHLGKPDIRGGELRTWAEDLRRLAALPNVCAKLSGLVTEADWADWKAEEIEPYLDVAFECFGAERLMIGSDWPVCTVAADYATTMRVVMRRLEALSVAERNAVLGGTAGRFYGAGLDGDSGESLVNNDLLIS